MAFELPRVTELVVGAEKLSVGAEGVTRAVEDVEGPRDRVVVERPETSIVAAPPFRVSRSTRNGNVPPRWRTITLIRGNRRGTSA